VLRAGTVLHRIRSRARVAERVPDAVFRKRSLADQSDEAGFTLVEVIVALAMLSVGLTVLLGMISSGIGRTSTAERTAEAASLAQSLLAEVGTELAVGAEERNGVFPHGYRWHLTMRPYRASRDDAERRVQLYRVAAQVDWGEGTDQRSFALSTLRLGPKASRP
jgi:general secretion pathway protein I